jgi:hypothetical protein
MDNKVIKEHDNQNSGWNASQEGHFIEDMEEADKIDHQEEKANQNVSETTEQKG